MRRWGPASVLTLVMGLLLVGAPGVAGEAQHDDHGWWWRAQTGALDLPPPPFVPEDGLAVARDVDGATAISALRFEVGADDVAGATLTLVEDGAQGGELAELRVCVASTTWSGAEAGVWDERPQADCAAGQATGLRDEENGVWEFDVGLLVEDGSLDVVLLPDVDDAEPDDAQEPPLSPGASTAEEEGGPPFQVAFEAPDDEALEVGGGFGDDFDADGFDEEAFEDEDLDDGGEVGERDAAGTESPPDVAEPRALDTGPSPSPQPDEPQEEPRASSPPEVAGPEASEQARAEDPVALAPPDERSTVDGDQVVAAPVGFGGERGRLLAGLMSLAAVVAAAVLMLGDRVPSVAGIAGLRSSRIVRPDVARSNLPGLSSHREGTAQGVVGGLGRFARPREGDPPSL
jgi:hypothetical protein